MFSNCVTYENHEKKLHNDFSCVCRKSVYVTVARETVTRETISVARETMRSVARETKRAVSAKAPPAPQQERRLIPMAFLQARGAPWWSLKARPRIGDPEALQALPPGHTPAQAVPVGLRHLQTLGEGETWRNGAPLAYRGAPWGSLTNRQKKSDKHRLVAKGCYSQYQRHITTSDKTSLSKRVRVCNAGSGCQVAYHPPHVHCQSHQNCHAGMLREACCIALCCIPKTNT